MTTTYSSLEFFKKMTQKSLTITTLDNQNAEYEGACFTSEETSYRSRLGKLTPKKKGYFIAMWEKDPKNNNQAYDVETFPDYLSVVILNGNKQGVFLFPKDVLLAKKILRTNQQPGKMAFRLYPTWETNLNPTATKTQAWQTTYFTDYSII